MTIRMEQVLRIPQVATAILDAHDRAHAEVATDLAALPEPIREVTTRWLRERAVEALAGIRASHFGPDGPLLLPIPRGFLGTESRERIAGTRRALDHIEVRLQALAAGELARAVAWETPFVIHALAAAGTSKPEDRVSLLRARRTGWRDRQHPYQPPEPSEVPDLLRATWQRLNDAGDPAAVTAAWFAFAWMTLHPFEDGNGRTARLLHQLVSAAGLSFSMDWGIAEMWVVHRTDYHERLKAGQGLAPSYDPRVIDARPFVEASLAWSTNGARLTATRIRIAADIADDLPGSDDLRAATLAVLLNRGTQPSQLMPGTYAEQVEHLERAVSAGTVVRDHLPARLAMPGNGHRPYYVPTTTTWRRLEQVLGRRQERADQR